MADDRLNLEARFNDKASAGVRKLGKTLADVKPSHGMAAAQKWFAEFRGVGEQAAKAVQPISSSLGAIGVGGLAASLSIGEMAKQFRELASQTLAMKEVGRQTGLTTTQVKRLKFAASELNIDPEKMVSGIRTMSDKMYDFHRQTGDLYGLLNQFDPNFSRRLMGDGDDPQQQLKDVVDWLAKIPEQQRAIGKSAADAAQIQRRWTEAFLGDGDLSRIVAVPGEFAAAMADAARKVPEVTKAMEDQAKALNQSVLDLNQSWDRLKNDVGPSVVHGMTEATDKLREAFDAIQAHPAEAAIGAGSVAALYARYRIMRAVSAGGAGAVTKAAGELTGAAARQGSAGTSLIEAAAALKEAAAELRGKGGTGGGSPDGPVKDAEKSAEKGGFAGSFRRMLPGLAVGGAIASVGAFVTYEILNRDQSKSLVDGGRPDVEPQDNNLGLPGIGDDAPSASDKWKAPSAYDREARARGHGYHGPTNTDGNALRRNDEMPAAVVAQEMFHEVMERATLSSLIGRAFGHGDAPPSASDKWKAPSAYDREARARGNGYHGPTNTDGNALRRNDEMPAAVVAQEMFHEVMERATLSPLIGRAFGHGDARPSASDRWKARSAYDREVLARAGGIRAATDTDGNALRRNDEMPAAVTAQELFDKVREGSKSGIIAGLREMAQEQELEAGGGEGRAPSGGLGGSGRHSAGASGFGARLGDHARGGIGRGAAAMEGGARESFEFWKSKGLTPEQAAGLAGMEQGESSFNPRAVGDGGRAHGAFQWHPDRRARILTGTGIDIDQATHRQQLEAAYWEFQHGERAAWEAVRRGRTASDAARAGVYLFERPADKEGQSIVRGGMGEGWLKRFNDQDAKTKTGPTAEAPSPAGTSAKAIDDAQVFAARQRIVNGSRDPADRALIERYRRQQNTPAAPVQAHKDGGAIRGPGGPRSDSILARLSNGEFVVNARAAGQFLPLLHAINDGRMPAFADGGPVGFGVDRRFYPTITPEISPEEGRANRRDWYGFFRRPVKDGGMGAPEHVALGALAMMQGETGWNLNQNSYAWDVNGPSGGVDQLHDVTQGKYAGHLHRLSDLMTRAMVQHVDWKDRTVQQANFRREAFGSMFFAWRKMMHAKTAAGTLRAGINDFENPAQHDLEFMRRMPNIIKLAREDAAVGREPAIDPIRLDIHHHETGRIRSVRATGGGKGVQVNLTRGPTFASASETH